MPHDLTDTDRARLLARAQKLGDAEIDDFGEEAREHWKGREAGLFKYSGDDQQLRKEFIDAGFAEVIQRGARSRPGTLKICPTAMLHGTYRGNAPAPASASDRFANGRPWVR
jgi:hypothetical protein